MAGWVGVSSAVVRDSFVIDQTSICFKEKIARIQIPYQAVQMEHCAICFDKRELARLKHRSICEAWRFAPRETRQHARNSGVLFNPSIFL